MKTINCKFAPAALALLMGAAFSGCNDYLDITPPSDVTAEVYFTQADQLGAYTLAYYNSLDQSKNTVVGSGGSNLIPSFGVGSSSYATFYGDDQGTDNENGTNDRFFDGAGKVKVPVKGGVWNFSTINNLNYFLETAVPKYEAGEIQGAEVTIRHYIGEGYLLRALAYFDKLKNVGDYPIIEKTLDLDREVLIDASKRQPRNKVARFILQDCDRALENLSDGATTGGRSRITRDVALLIKARVALYEGTFEKYFAGTPFVPERAAGWPGAAKEYNNGVTYDNNAEVTFFLDQALAASKELADRHPALTANNKKMIGAEMNGMPANPYYDLFAGTDPSGRDEALMFRTYDSDLGAVHTLNQYIKNGTGYTQEFANAFLMDNGLPIYASGSGYAGDDFVVDTKTGRDWRWRLFMKAPNEYVYEGMDMRIGEGQKNKKDAEYKAPALISGGVDFTTSTGYTKGKGWSTNPSFGDVGKDETACVIYRSAEAYLIYIEAAWERYGDGLDAFAWDLWGKLRVRAGLPQDSHITINATDLAREEETSHDFALYSAGRRITSPVLYNIRRERRCEFISEGMRWDDLVRWRSMDQLRTKRYFKHGCKVWGPMNEWFKHKSGKLDKLLYGQSDPNKNNVSDPSDIEGGFNGNPEYFSLLRTSSRSDWYESGYSWRMAHYLSPISEDDFFQSSQSGHDIDSSPIYQNPYWSTTHDTSAIE